MRCIGQRVPDLPSLQINQRLKHRLESGAPAVSPQAEGQEAQNYQTLPLISLFSLDEEERGAEEISSSTPGLTQPALNYTYTRTQWPEISRHIKRPRPRYEGLAAATSESVTQGDGNKKAKKQWRTGRGKVLFSIDGGVWDSGDEDEDEDEGKTSYEHYQENCDLQQVKKRLWDAKFKGRQCTHGSRGQYI